MNIIQEKIDEQNALIKITINPDDYQSRVNKAIKEHGKKVKMPGFRPGMVPASHIKRLYGKSILVDEINNLLSDSLNNYIVENKLEVLGQPLPKVESPDQYNWNMEETFEFTYEIGLAPSFDLQISEKDTFTNYVVKADPETIESRLTNLRRSYGKMTNPEVAEAGDVLYGDFAQLTPDGSVFEGGITNTASLRLDLIEDQNVLKSLIGAKKEDVLTIDLKKAFNNNAHLIANLLKIEESDAQELVSSFQLAVKNVNRLEAADLNEEFFAKLFPDGSVKTEEDMRAKVAEEVELMMVSNADNKLKADVYSYFVDKHNLSLPDEFLKRWLRTANENPVTEEQLQEEYPNFARNLKWTLIENKLSVRESVEVKPEEVVALAKQRIAAQFMMYSPTPMADEQLDQYTMNFLQDRERAGKIYEEARSNKVFEVIKDLVTIEKKEIAYNDFIALN